MRYHLVVPDSGDINVEKHLKSLYQELSDVCLIIYLDKNFNLFNINWINVLTMLNMYRPYQKRFLVKTEIYIENKNISFILKAFLKFVKPEKPVKIISC